LTVSLGDHCFIFGRKLGDRYQEIILIYLFRSKFLNLSFLDYHKIKI